MEGLGKSEEKVEKRPKTARIYKKKRNVLVSHRKDVLEPHLEGGGRLKSLPNFGKISIYPPQIYSVVRVEMLSPNDMG